MNSVVRKPLNVDIPAVVVLRVYVNSIFHKPLNADIVAVAVLAQLVHEFDFSQAIER